MNGISHRCYAAEDLDTEVDIKPENSSKSFSDYRNTMRTVTTEAEFRVIHAYLKNRSSQLSELPARR